MFNDNQVPEYFDHTRVSLNSFEVHPKVKYFIAWFGILAILVTGSALVLAI